MGVPFHVATKVPFLVAISNDLPFDSRARVRNLNNDREVELRVNDRVPLEALNNGRILDVSYAAARQLEMVEDGVVPIEITVLAWGPSR